MLHESFIYIADILFKRDPVLRPKIEKLIKEREDYELKQRDERDNSNNRRT